MFFDEHKKIATIIAGKRNDKGDRIMEPTPMKPEVMKSKGGEVDGRHLAAQEILAAHHEQSPMKLMEALSNFMDIHHSMKDAMPDKE
jgi:hypothetical protein